MNLNGTIDNDGRIATVTHKIILERERKEELAVSTYMSRIIILSE